MDKLYEIKDQCHVVIRASNERTCELCAELVNDIFGFPAVIIQETPFIQALESSLRSGIESKKEWLICIDADVLIYRNGVDKLLGKLLEQKDKYFEIQGRIVDKFFYTPKKGGIHAYRISKLPLALEVLEKQKNDTTQRPERTLILNMDQLGHKHLSLDIIIGLHDFEQFNADIYRKCFFHAQKHLNDLPNLITYFRQNVVTDTDYRIGLLGLSDGIAGPELDYNKKGFSHTEASQLQLSSFIEKTSSFTIEDRVRILKIIEEKSEEYQLKLKKTKMQKFKKRVKKFLGRD